MTPPIPSTEVWLQFPLVAVIVLCFILAGAGIFFFTKWIWGEYKIERQKDLDWRENQNKQREAAVAEQNKLWREAMAERDTRYETYDRERQSTLKELAASMEGIASQLKEHDQQAKQIAAVVNRVEENTRPLPGQPGFDRRRKKGEE
jgi:response regulator RpfG family c-di-GMP phosphodiesterase